ncbi:MAG: 2Fe-2S iron-sulfur cluster-binding protein [archaeon]
MPKLKHKGKAEDILLGSAISDAAEKLGVKYGCRVGVCGLCKIEIISGMENLSEKTQEENDYELINQERLACQCTLEKEGDVEIDFLKQAQ